jgi:hypothetical protein
MALIDLIVGRDDEDDAAPADANAPVDHLIEDSRAAPARNARPNFGQDDEVVEHPGQHDEVVVPAANAQMPTPAFGQGDEVVVPARQPRKVSFGANDGIVESAKTPPRVNGTPERMAPLEPPPRVNGTPERLVPLAPPSDALVDAAQQVGAMGEMPRRIAYVPEAPEQPFRTGGTVLDFLFGPNTGMLSGKEAYEYKYGRPQRDAFLGAPAQEAVPGSIAEAEGALAKAKLERAAAQARLDELLKERSANPEAAVSVDPRAVREALRLTQRRESQAEAALEAAKKAPLPTQGVARNLGETAIRTAAQMGADTLTGARGLTEVIPDPLDWLDPELAKRVRTKNRAFTKSVDQAAKRAGQPDPARADDFSTQLTAGAVSMGMFMAGGVAARSLGASAALGAGGLGAFQMGGSQFAEAEAALKDIEQRIVTGKQQGYDVTGLEAKRDELLKTKYIALFAGMALGATEAIPIERFFSRLNQVTNGRVAAILTNASVQSFEEAVQEIGQQVGSNVVAKLLYEEGREIFKDVGESAAVAVVLGGLMGGGARMKHGAHSGAGASTGMPMPVEPAPVDLSDIQTPPGATPPPPGASNTPENASTPTSPSHGEGGRTPAQVQREQGVPYGEAAKIAEAEGWKAPEGAAASKFAGTPVAQERSDATGAGPSTSAKPSAAQNPAARPFEDNAPQSGPAAPVEMKVNTEAVPAPDLALLRGAGYADQQIAAMGDKERSAEIADAKAQGVEPVKEPVRDSPSNEPPRTESTETEQSRSRQGVGPGQAGQPSFPGPHQTDENASRITSTSALARDDHEQIVNKWREVRTPLPANASVQRKDVIRGYRRELSKLGLLNAKTEGDVRNRLMDREGERLQATEPETIAGTGAAPPGAAPPSASRIADLTKGGIFDKDEQIVNKWREVRKPLPVNASTRRKDLIRGYRRELSRLGLLNAKTEADVRNRLMDRPGERLPASEPETIAGTGAAPPGAPPPLATRTADPTKPRPPGGVFDSEGRAMPGEIESPGGARRMPARIRDKAGGADAASSNDTRDAPSGAVFAGLTPAAEEARPVLESAVLSAVEQVAGPDAARRTATPDRIAERPGRDWNLGHDQGQYESAGAYYPGRERSGVFPLIAVALADNPDAVRTAYSEGWHAIEGTLTATEIAILRRETPRLRKNVIAQAPDLADAIGKAEAEEIWSEAAANHAIAQANGEFVGGIHIAVRRIFAKIMRLLARIRNAVAGLGFHTSEDIFESFARGEMAVRREALPADMRTRWWGAETDEASSSIRRRGANLRPPARPPDKAVAESVRKKSGARASGPSSLKDKEQDAPGSPRGMRMPGIPRLAGEAARAAESVWRLGWAARGWAIEPYFIGKRALPDNFPVIDQFKGGIATSIKSIDLAAASYQNMDTLTNRLNRYVDLVAAFNGAEFGGSKVHAWQIVSRELKLVIPSRGASIVQRSAIAAAAARARRAGVRLAVIPFP